MENEINLVQGGGNAEKSPERWAVSAAVTAGSPTAPRASAMTVMPT